jgi:hypothetical protein
MYMLSQMARELLEKKWQWMRVALSNGLACLGTMDVVAVERTCLHTHDPTWGWESDTITAF